MTIPSWVIPLIFRATHRNKAYISAEGAQKRVQARTRKPAPADPPQNLRPDVRIDIRHEDGWPIYTFTPTKTDPVGSVIYLHGGGWVNQIFTQQWQLAAQIAAESSTVVTVPIYPLVPHGTADAVVSRVVTIVEADKAKHGSVALAGDSAGGEIALSAAMVLRDKGVTLAATVLISPSVDLTFSNPRIPDVQPSDPWLGVPGGLVFAKLWSGERDLRDPIVSPLFGDFAGLGPLTVYSGTHDILNPDARLLVTKAKASGVDVHYTEVKRQLHVYPLLPTRVGASARRDIVARIAAALRGISTSSPSQ